MALSADAWVAKLWWWSRFSRKTQPRVRFAHPVILKYRGCSVRVRTLLALCTSVLLLALCGVALSQSVQGVITGTVTDPSGGAVPNATVTLTNSGTNVSQTQTTGSDGSYRFSLVPPGSYIVTVKATNFAEVRASGIVVQASQTVPFDVKLEIAKAQATIEVTEQVALVQTATSDLSTQIDRTTILNTPLADRDVLATLPFLAPQVSPGIDMMPTSGGARESGTSYLLNGGDDNDNFSEGAINIRPPLESVQDFAIITNSMSAEYGRGGGALVTVNQTTGTNKYHGAIYEFNRNALLNANGWFYDRDVHNDTQGLLSKRPKYIRNQFGGEVDGPVIKDKTFFSFAYDRIKLLASTTNANNFVPTSASLAYMLANANGNGGGSPSVAQQVLKAYPPVTSDNPCPFDVSAANPNGVITGKGTAPDGLPGYWDNGVPNPVGCLSFSDPETDTEDSYYARVDHNFSSKDRLSAAVNIYRQNFVDKFGGGPLNTVKPISGTTSNHFHNITLSETHVFNPRLVNEARVSHNRHFNEFLEGNGQNTIPSIVIDNQTGGCLGYDLGGPFEGGQLQNFTQDRWSGSDNLTLTAGRHSLKFGGGMQHGVLYRNWDLGQPGYYEFGELSAINTGGAAPTCAAGAQITPACDGTLQPDGTIANVNLETNANFTADYPYFMETSIEPSTGAKANAYRHYTYHDYYAFFQDDWKVKPRLTLNLGVRWDRYGAPSEDHGILAQFTNLSSCNILTFSCIANARTGPVGRMWNTRNHDFAPRVGFAWDIFGNGKMAVRGGYGIYYDRIFDNIWSNGAWNPPFYALADLENDTGDAIFFSNPTSVGPGYAAQIAANPACQIPNAAVPGVCSGHRVSIRTMDVNMKDSSGENFYLGIERQFLNNFLLRVNYQGSMGRHLPMLENYNRLDGIGYYNFANNPATIRGSQSPTRPNPLYSGFNYRSNSVSSNYNSLVAEIQKRMSNGLQFQTGYTFSKLLDVNSELFAGCSNVALTANTYPYYYITNTNQKLSYGRAGFDHRHSYKFSVTYEVPFFKSEKGFLGHALGGWQLGSFFQLYSGHPIDVSNGRAHIRARDANGKLLLDQNGAPINIGGDYNLDGVLNDHPNFLGSSLSSVYSGGSPADGIFTDNNRIGCGEAGVPGTVSLGTSSSQCVGFTPSTLFGNPAYPISGTTPYERFGTLGRDIFTGPKFLQMDMSLGKTFKLTETMKLEFRAQAQNLTNHPSFDCVQADLSKSTFGQALCLAQQNNGSSAGSLGAPISRVMSLGLRLAF